MLAQAKHRFSVGDYHRMGEAGVLRHDARVELLDGEIIDMSPIGPLHGGLVNRLNRLFNRVAKGRWLVAVQNPVRLDEHSEPQPDLMLLRPAADDYTAHHPGAGEVLLLVEVADSSLTYDREVKLPAYGRAGIAELWIVNLADQTIEIFREPHFDGYATSRTVRAGEQAALTAFPDVIVDVADLLK